MGCPVRHMAPDCLTGVSKVQGVWGLPVTFRILWHFEHYVAPSVTDSHCLPLTGMPPSTRPTYGWFTEGLDTADLQEAKALLEAWVG